MNNDLSNLPRLTPQYIDSLVKDVAYYVFPNTTTTVCCITLINGFNVIGESSAGSPNHFDTKIGEERAYATAHNKIWAFAYHLACQQLFELPKE